MPDDAAPWQELSTELFTLTMLVGTAGVDPFDGNMDIEVVLAGTDERWGATVYTLANLDTLMRRWERSGECGGGRYFIADRALIVRELSPDGLVAVLNALLDAGDFESAMERLDRSE